MTYIINDDDLETARWSGGRHAAAEFELGNSVPSNEVLDENDKRQLVWRITGQKLEPDTDEAEMLVRAYEDAYYEVWEDLT